MSSLIVVLDVSRRIVSRVRSGSRQLIGLFEEVDRPDAIRTVALDRTVALASSASLTAVRSDWTPASTAPAATMHLAV